MLGVLLAQSKFMFGLYYSTRPRSRIENRVHHPLAAPHTHTSNEAIWNPNRLRLCASHTFIIYPERRCCRRKVLFDVHGSFEHTGWRICQSNWSRVATSQLYWASAAQFLRNDGNKLDRISQCFSYPSPLQYIHHHPTTNGIF